MDPKTDKTDSQWTLIFNDLVRLWLDRGCDRRTAEENAAIELRNIFIQEMGF